MNITVFADSGNMFVNFAHIKGIAFKNAVILAESALLREYYVRFNRFRRLSPMSGSA
jgi:hypothetical protein